MDNAWRHFGPWTVLVLAVILLAFIPSFVGRYTLFIAYFAVLNVALAQSWNLVGGYTGLISLGHAAFFGLGAYAAATSVITYKLPLFASFLIGGLTAAIFALLISFPIFRFRGIYFAIGTLVLAEALRLWMINWEYTGGAQGMQFPIGIGPGLAGFFHIMLALAAGSTALLMYISRSKLGIGLRAIRDNENSAQNLGVDIFRTKLTAFLISAFIAGLVGAVHATRLGAIEPYSIFGAAWTIGVVNIVIIGGMGTIFGPIVGAIFVTILAELLADFPGVHLLIEGAILILVIRFMPYGVWGYVLRLIGRVSSLNVLRTRAGP